MKLANAAQEPATGLRVPAGPRRLRTTDTRYKRASVVRQAVILLVRFFPLLLFLRFSTRIDFAFLFKLGSKSQRTKIRRPGTRAPNVLTVSETSWGS